jgi:N-acetylglucosamine transport system substrate-binding protein
MRLVAGIIILLAFAIAAVWAVSRPIAPQGTASLEVACFYGGYGGEWYKHVVDSFQSTQDDPITIDFWLDPRVNVKLRPRLLQKNPPDLVYDPNLPNWKLIRAGEYASFDDALDSPAWGKPDVTWRQTFAPGTLDAFKYDGKVYGIPLDMGIWVIWYNRALFREHGWTTPETWDELLTLCEQIKKTDVAPFAFQGLYPAYGWASLVVLFERIAGLQIYYDYQNLRPGVFLNPHFIRAAELWQDLSLRYFQEGCWGMSHTTSQMQWVNGKAAMIPCGLWLAAEMRDNMPPGFEMDCFSIPAVDGQLANARYELGGAGNHFFMFQRSPNHDQAVRFMKYMTSDPMMSKAADILGTITPVPSSYSDTTTPPELQSALDMIRHSDGIFSDRVGFLYVQWTLQTVSPLLTELMRGRISPSDFARRLEDSVEKDIRSKPEFANIPIVEVPLFSQEVSHVQ